MDSKISIWSDGSAAIGGDAASAVYLRGAGTLLKVVLFLGPATSIESELFGGILARLVVRALLSPAQLISVEWFSDCQTVVDLANANTGTGPLWKLWREAGETLQCESHFLKNNQRRVEHSACDHASRWVQEQGEKLLKKYGEGPIGRSAARYPDQCWWLVDGRSKNGPLSHADSSVLLERLCERLEKILTPHPAVSALKKQLLADQ